MSKNLFLLKSEKNPTPKGDKSYSARALSFCSTQEARRSISFEDATRLEVLPLGLLTLYGESVLTVAFEGRPTPELVKTIRFMTGFEVRFTEVPRGIVQEAIYIAYKGDHEELVRESRALSLKAKASHHPWRTELSFRPASGDAAQFLASCVEYAIAQQASDLHFNPRSDGCWARMRVNGELLSSNSPICSNLAYQQMVNRVKVLSGLDINSKDVPLDGKFVVPKHGGSVDVRVSILPTIHGDSIVLRFLGVRGILSLDALGLPMGVLHRIESLLQCASGMIIVSGPTGAGKTTTLYGFVSKLLAQNKNIVAIEDPVEYTLESISQTSINERSGLSYARALRAVLRQDPDVILIGEIRDKESAQLAFEASLTGHLVLSTIHGKDPFEVLMRAESLGLDRRTIAQSTSLILSQRLLPKLCSSCKVFDLVNSNGVGFEVYKEVGCASCDYTGYQGRLLAAEMLDMTSSIREKFIRCDSLKVEISNSDDESYIAIDDSVGELLSRGEISMKTLKSITL